MVGLSFGGAVISRRPDAWVEPQADRDPCWQQAPGETLADVCFHVKDGTLAVEDAAVRHAAAPTKSFIIKSSQTLHLSFCF